MIYEGIKFRINRNILALPSKEEGKAGYVEFYAICKKDKKGAIKTEYFYGETNEPVYAFPVINHGHSRTNMMYGSRNNILRATQVFLAYDGACFTAPIKCEQ